MKEAINPLSRCKGTKDGPDDGSVLSFFMKNGRCRAFISWKRGGYCPAGSSETATPVRMSVKGRRAVLILILLGVTVLTVFLFLLRKKDPFSEWNNKTGEAAGKAEKVLSF